jgi:hypothetical protein
VADAITTWGVISWRANTARLAGQHNSGRDKQVALAGRMRSKSKRPII